MTREKAKEICDIIDIHGIEVIRAYGEGKVIQRLNLDGEWVDCDMPIAFVNNHSFRVKPLETDHSCNCKNCKYTNLESVDEPCNDCVDSDKYEKEKLENILLKDCEVYDKKIAEEYTTLEERITELEKENLYYKDVIETNTDEWEEQGHRVVELEKEISILLSCKNCPDNKGGYICQKEYEDKCLAQKINNWEEFLKSNIKIDIPESAIEDIYNRIAKENGNLKYEKLSQ